MEPGSAFGWQTGPLVAQVVDVVEDKGIKMKKDLQTCQCELERVTSQPVSLFRPPFGVTNPTTLEIFYWDLHWKPYPVSNIP